ncbi:MAG: hypothetical protein K1W02_11065 [Muribaculaceae bacterium]|jgi:hypothetical protein
MDKRIIGDKIVCTKCGTVNIIYEDGIKYPARIQEILYCAKCNEVLGYKNSTVSLDTRIE